MEKAARLRFVECGRITCFANKKQNEMLRVYSASAINEPVKLTPSMKILSPLAVVLRQRSTATSHLLGVVAGLAAIFFLVTPSTVVAQGDSSGCKQQVCHKGRQTLTVSCNAVAAHQAHGDTLGPCPATPSRKQATKDERAPAKTRVPAAKLARVQFAVE